MDELLIVTKIKYQHDAQSPVIESNVVFQKIILDGGREKSEYVIEATGKELKTPDSNLRHIHSGLIWEVDSQNGGWCETWTEDGKTLMYRHDADRKDMEVKP